MCSHSARAAAAAMVWAAEVAPQARVDGVARKDTGVSMEVPGGQAPLAAAVAAADLLAVAGAAAAAAEVGGRLVPARVGVARVARTVERHQDTSQTECTTTTDQRPRGHERPTPNVGRCNAGNRRTSCTHLMCASKVGTRVRQENPCSRLPQRAMWVTGHPAACRSGTKQERVAATVAAARVVVAPVVEARAAGSRAAVEAKVGIARRRTCRQQSGSCWS